MKSSEQIDTLIAEQSAEWIEILKNGNERDVAAFAQWSLKSPQHMRQFLMMVALDRELDSIDPQRRMEIPSDERSGKVLPLSDRTSNGRSAIRRRPLRRWAALAACVVGAALLSVAYFQKRNTGWQEFATAQSEQRAVELADGSIMHLNTQSRVEVRFSAQRRDIRLLGGEALFKVAKDAARPFRVHTSDLVIQALGTQFNVYTQGSATKVSVLEGRVQISSERPAGTSAMNRPTKLGAGEEVEIDNTGRITARETTDVTTVAAWRQRRLVFNQDPLSEVVREFNRYNRAPQFHIADPDIGLRPYSGAFDADDPESLVELLSVDPDLEIRKNGAGISIHRRIH